MTKTADQTGSVRVGATINYTVTVVNNGNTTVKGINVADELTGERWSIDTLTSGGSKEFNTSYTVTEADVAAGKVTNVATAQGVDANGDPVESNGQTSNDVNQSFNLTIHYVDENGNPVAADYQNSYPYKHSFYVQSPEVSGYTPTYTFVSSDENGMPGKDVEVTVTYVKNPESLAETPTTSTTNVTNITNITNETNRLNETNVTNETNDDDDDDDDDSDSSTAKNTTSSSGTTRSTGKSDSSSSKAKKADSSRKAVSTGDDNDANAGVKPDGTTTSVATATPAANNGTVRRSGGGSARTGKDGGARITVDKDGKPQLIAASDTETPLFNLGLDDHKCNVLRLLILLVAFAIVIAHTRQMRKSQSRIFELREKLDEAKKQQ